MTLTPLPAAARPSGAGPARPTVQAEPARGDAALVRPPEASAAEERPARPFAELDIALDADSQAAWIMMAPRDRPAFTPALLLELRAAHREIRAARAEAGFPLNFAVLASRRERAFGYGLDLGAVASLARAGAWEGLAAYAGLYAEAIQGTIAGLDLPLITAALVRGDALGAGFEAALACDVIVAERGARLGFPEPLLGLPGLFAEPLLTRRVTGARAGEVAASGRLYDAEDLHALGVVDVLAEQGRGEEAMRDALARASRRFNAQQAVYAVRRRVRPVTRAAVADLVERWIGAVMTLSERDLRNLDRLAAAQREAAASPARPETLAG